MADIEDRRATVPSSAALRMRRHRERRRNGMRCMTIELRETEVTGLIRKGMLKEDARNEIRAIRNALEDRRATVPSSAALRMRRHRERRRNGMRCMTIELRETEVTALIRKGLLTDDARNEIRAIRNALYRFLDRTLNP
jgi:hypothetical protein